MRADSEGVIRGVFPEAAARSAACRSLARAMTSASGAGSELLPRGVTEGTDEGAAGDVGAFGSVRASACSRSTVLRESPADRVPRAVSRCMSPRTSAIWSSRLQTSGKYPVRDALAFHAVRAERHRSAAPAPVAAQIVPVSARGSSQSGIKNPIHATPIVSHTALAASGAVR